MPDQLFKVRVVTNVVISTDSSDNAETEAIAVVRTRPMEVVLSADAVPLRSLKELPADWSANATPFGLAEEDERTVRQMLVERTVVFLEDAA